MSKVLIPTLVEPAAEKRRMTAADRRRESTDRLYRTAELVLSSPLIAGLVALAGNELVYRAGFYGPVPSEAERSFLGGPVLFQIGGPPPTQAQLNGRKKNLVDGLIISCTVIASAASAIKILR